MGRLLLTLMEMTHLEFLTFISIHDKKVIEFLKLHFKKFLISCNHRYDPPNKQTQNLILQLVRLQSKLNIHTL